MATAAVSTTLFPDRDAILYTWILTQADTVGEPITAHELGDRCLQMTGTFGTGTFTLEGANVATYTVLTDPQGNGVSKTAAAIEQIMEVPRFMRPNSSGSTGGESVTVTLFCRRTRR